MTTKPTSRHKARGAMKVTTVRFGEDLWALLADEAGHAGVSVSQYVREAALARAAFAAGARADLPSDLFRAWARTALDGEADLAERRRVLDGLIGALSRARRVDDSSALRAESQERSEETAALIAESKQTARHAREVRRGTARRDGR
jgi:hypothetical protein